MLTVNKLLQGKKTNMVYHVSPQDMVIDALELMARKNIGAVMVMDGDQLIGIFSERDYARKVILMGKASKETAVAEIMTDKVMYVTPANTVQECMALMTKGHFRHLPVLDDEQKVIGVVSIGDLVKETICEQQFIIDQLQHYITN
jgi:CBS domain-containing protein